MFTGTFELGDEEEEEIYEVINISKIKAHTPNLKVRKFQTYRPILNVSKIKEHTQP